MEFWDVYNENREKTGDVMKRNSPQQAGKLHLVVHICILNAKGQMLIQQRQPFKKGWSGLWDFSARGSALRGEDSGQAAEREIFEELGLKLDLTNVRPYMTINFSGGFDDVYIVQHDVPLSELKLQSSEVKDAKWAYKDEILDMIDNGTFAPYYKSFVNLIFDMENRYGAYTRDD